LKEENLNLVFIKNGKIIFESRSKGIIDLVRAVELFKKNLRGASVADTLVGKAAALLFVYSKIHSVFAQTVSASGKNVLKKSNIFLEYERFVPKILNREKADICPFEKLTSNINSPEEAFKTIKSSFKKLLIY
jgi:hypothetical protein